MANLAPGLLFLTLYGSLWAILMRCITFFFLITRDRGLSANLLGLYYVNEEWGLSWSSWQLQEATKTPHWHGEGTPLFLIMVEGHAHEQLHTGQNCIFPYVCVWQSERTPAAPPPSRASASTSQLTAAAAGDKVGMLAFKVKAEKDFCKFAFNSKVV